MMDEKLKRAQSLVGYSEGRPEFDFYPTPSIATQALLDREKFNGSIGEPACGDGAMSKVIIANGYNNVTSRDIVDYGYGDVCDFLESDTIYNNIMTNPPYKLAQEFVEHALSRTNEKVAMLCKLQFLEGAKRKKMFETTPLQTVYVFSKRISLTRNGVKMKNSGMIAFAWFLWNHNYKGEPTIKWI